MTTAEPKPSLDFIRTIIAGDVEHDRNGGTVVTRFPPEPNGYLHVGHAMAICLNFAIAEEFGGVCHLRFDDTNPSKEEQEYVDSIRADIRWLGFDWAEKEFFTSDYFQQLHDFAVRLIRDGKAYVCDLNAEETREYRGTLTAPGRDSPHRDRSVEENLDLFARMRNGEFDDGARTLRAKIDMASPNVNLRDPVIYRIQKVTHHRTGDDWPIYPMYDFAHGQSDSIEGITHSLCTLEFEAHRPLYDWFVEALGIHHPQQIEFARLNVGHVITSKRKLRQLVDENHVTGWDDPRMPTISGMRRRGYPPAALRNFVRTTGVAKREKLIDPALLEHCVRDELNRTAPRVLAVLNPLRVVVENFPEGDVDWLDAVNNPEDPDAGSRKVPFSRVIYVERDDFMEDPPRKFFRLSPGREVRLRYAYLMTCNDVIKDDEGTVVELRCTIDPESRGGSAPDGRKVKATMHWVSAEHALAAEIRVYDRLFSVANPAAVAEGETFLSNLNPESLRTIDPAWVEPSVKDAAAGTSFQFERLGYFCVDPDSTEAKPVFNRTVPLRDAWAKIADEGGGKR